MPSISKTVVVNVPIEKAYDCVTDPTQLQPLFPGWINMLASPELPLHVGSMLTMEVQFLGLQLEGEWRVEELRRPNYYMAKSIRGVTSRWVYILTALDNRTVLTLDIQYEAPKSLLKQYAMRFIEPHADHLIESFIASLKNYLEIEHREHASRPSH